MKKTKLSENALSYIGNIIEVKWGTSRGRDTYGYTTCSLSYQGKRIASCNGGGYDMRGTVVGHWIAYSFPDELRALKESQMPEESHWQPDHTRLCDGQCKAGFDAQLMAAIEAEQIEKMTQPRLSADCFECPVCKGKTRASGDGKRVSIGRRLYGLSFYDPNYDLGTAVVKHAPVFGKEEDAGKTVAVLEAEGKSLGLERYQAFYAATCPHSTQRHVRPIIDGACGLSSVERILKAIGLSLRQVVNASKLDVYLIGAAE